MSRPLPGQVEKSHSNKDNRIREPIESSIAKAIQKLTSTGNGEGFGIIDRKTLEVCACYRDSVKYSIFALIGTFIVLVN